MAPATPTPTPSTSLSTHLTTANYYLFELFIFWRLLALSISAIAISVLIQDKICIVNYNQTIEFCQYIEADVDSVEATRIRDAVLAEAAVFNNWRNLIECTPMVLLSFFVGSFLDNYSGGTFVIMFLNVAGDLYSIAVYLLLSVYQFNSTPYLMLFASLSVCFTGGTMAFMTTAYRYITLTTDEANRALKFVVLEIIFVIGLSISVFFGGQLLKVQPTSSTTPRTYSHNFQFALFFDLLALLTLLALQYISTRYRKADVQASIVYHIEDDLLKVNNIVLTSFAKNVALDGHGTSPDGKRVSLESEQPPPTRPTLLQVMFNLESAISTIHCFTKSRPHHFRLLIYLIFIVLFNQVLTSSGIHGVLLQFVEKVYNWNTKTYSTFVAVSHVVSTLVLAISSVFLVKYLKLDDGTLIVLAQISAFTAYVVIGTFTTPSAFFAAIILGSLHGYAVICIRTKISKVVPEDEVGRIFCISCTLEALVPLISSLIYSGLFSASISTYPTLIYQFSAGVMLVSLIVMTIEVFLCPVQSRAEAEAIEARRQLRGQQMVNGGGGGVVAMLGPDKLTLN